MPTPPETALNAKGKVEDFNGPHQRIRDETKQHGKKHNHARDDAGKIMSWRHYYKQPKRKDFEPGSSLADRIESAPPTPPRRVKDQTPGGLLLNVLREAHARGALPTIHATFNEHKDSNGKKWSKKPKDLINHKFQPGMTMLQLIRWLEQHDFAEVRMQGRRLCAYKSGTGKTHNRIVLAKGDNLVDAPKAGSSRDVATHIYVESQSGVHGWVGDHKARRAWGRRIEIYKEIDAVKHWDEAERRGRKALDRTQNLKQRRTYGVVPDRGANPYHDYEIGDFIYVLEDGAPTKHRVRQIGLTWDDDGAVLIALTLTHKLLPQKVRDHRRLRSLTGKLADDDLEIIPRRPEQAQSDERAPNPPSAPQPVSRSGAVEIAYDGLDEQNELPIWDTKAIELHVGTEEGFEPSDDTLVHTYVTAGSTTLVAPDYDTVYYAKHVAVDEGGDRSAPSEEVPVVMQKVNAGDISPGAVGSDELDPDLPIGTDGLPPASAPTPVGLPMARSIFASFTPLPNPDPQRYYWHATLDNTSPPSSATRIPDSNTSAAMSTLTKLPDGTPFYSSPETNLYGQTIWIALEAYDDDVDTTLTTGPLSPWVPTNLDPLGTVDLAAESVTANKLAAVVALITKLMTAETGPRVQIDPAGITSLGAGAAGAEEIVALIPTDAVNQDIQLLANIVAKALTILGNLQVQGSTNSIAKGSQLLLDGKFDTPSTPPTISTNYDAAALATDAFPTFKRGFHHVSALFNVTNKALTSNVATLTIGTHTLVVGETVVIAGVDATFNGTFTITAKTSTTISYAKTASDVSSQAATGTATGQYHNHYFYGTALGWVGGEAIGSSITEVNEAGGQIGAYQLLDATSGMVDAQGGITRIGSDWYALTYYQPDDEWWVYKYVSPLTLTNVPTASWQYTHDPNGGRPAIGTDGTNILIARTDGSNNLKVRTYNTTGTLSATVTRNVTMGGSQADIAGVMYLTADFPAGTNQYVVVPRSSGVFNENWIVLQGNSDASPGNDRSNYAWPIANQHTVSGAAYNALAGKFVHLSEATANGLGQIVSYTANFWTTENPKWWFSYSWYDDDGTAHETPQSPRASKTMIKRARITGNTPTIPDFGDADDPNKARIYVGRRSDSNTTDPGRTSMWLQGTTTSGTFLITSTTFSGTNPPSATDFPDATPAKILTQAGQLLLSGDGTTGPVMTGQVVGVTWAVSGGGTVLEGGYVKLDNTEVARSGVYLNLWNKIGSVGGGGNGTSTFNLPDFRGRVPIGAGTYAALGGTEGMSEANRTTGHTHSHGHTHDITATNHSGISNASYAETGSKNLVQSVNGTVGTSHAHGGNTGQPGDPTTGVGGGVNDFPHFAIHWLIKL